MVVEDSGGKEGTLERKRKMTPQIVRVSINRLRGSTKKKRREENRESIVSCFQASYIIECTLSVVHQYVLVYTVPYTECIYFTVMLRVYFADTNYFSEQ